MQRLVSILAVLAVSLPNAFACSLSPGTMLRSNFEMVAAVDAIVVATAKKGFQRQADSGDYSLGAVSFEVREVLKGEPPELVFDTRGQLGDPLPSDPLDIHSANPEAYRGPCRRMTYSETRDYVLFLKQNDRGEFVVSGDAFSRMNEDHFGEASLWRRTIATYLDIQSIPDRMMQIEKLKELAVGGLEPGASFEARQIGADAFNHLHSIHPDKPTPWLLAIYDDPANLGLGGSPEQFTTDDRLEGTEEGQISKIVSLAFDDGTEIGPSVRADALRALAEGNHEEVGHIFEAVLGDPSSSESDLGAAFGYYYRSGEFEQVRAEFLQQLFLSKAGISRPSKIDLMEAFYGVAGWAVRRNDPAMGSWLDRQSFLLCMLRAQDVDCAPPDDMPPPDYLLEDPRSHPKLAIVYSAEQTAELLIWASEEVKRLQSEDESIFDSVWKLPLRMLIAGYDIDDPGPLRDLACSDDSLRWIIATEIGEVPGWSSGTLLRSMMQGETDEELRIALFESAMSLFGRDYEYYSDDILAFAREEPVDFNEPAFSCQN